MNAETEEIVAFCEDLQKALKNLARGHYNNRAVDIGNLLYAASEVVEAFTYAIEKRESKK